MINISEITKKYNISKEEVLKLLKEHTWKEYSKSTSRIWDSTFAKIEKFLKVWKTAEEKSSKKNNYNDKKKKTVSLQQKKENKKVLTSHDIEGTDFLAATLWIKSVKKNNNEFKKDEKEQKKSFEVVKKKDFSTKTNVFNNKFEKKTKNSFKVSKKWDKKLNSKNIWENIEFSKTQEKRIEKKIEKKMEKKIEKKVEKKPKVSDTLKKKDKIVIWDSISVKELSEKIWVSHVEIIKTFIKNGMPVWVNSSVDFDTVVLLADEFWVKVERENVKSDISAIIEWNLKEIVEIKNSQTDNLKERPPIVTIMWHVDHGKTKLLDYIRKSDVVAKEAGGITQSIWASQITHEGKKITFIDTPWHELFTAMRARGAKITDIAVIVVAGDEWVKQQTIEAINHAKDAGVSIIVAITKIDKPNVNINLVKSQMSEHGLVPEDWGGDTPFVALSAVTGEWVDELLEYILLQAEMLELKYNPDVPAVWVVLEASKDQKTWTVATLLLVTWTLNKKDPVVAYDVFWKIRLMKDWSWKVVKQVYGWDPVQVIWFENVPEAGRIFEVFPSEKEAQKQVDQIKELIKQQKNKNVLTSLLDKMKAGENVELKVILKAGDFGWLEALKYAVWKVNLPEWVTLKVIHEEVWQVKETDISLAEASGAFIFGFNSGIQSTLKKKLEQKKIVYKNFTIIYELLDYIEQLAWWMIEKEVEEIKIWEFEFIALFYKKWNDMIIGWKVLDGVVKNWAHFVVKRWGEELWWGKVTSLKIEQENVNEVKAWRECGVRVRTGARFKKWDILEFYIYKK